MSSYVLSVSSLCLRTSRIIPEASSTAEGNPGHPPLLTKFRATWQLAREARVEFVFTIVLVSEIMGLQFILADPARLLLFCCAHLADLTLRAATPPRALLEIL